MNNTWSARQEYLRNFEKIISGLNEAQLEAVNSIDGPVLTIAGPGTGKTHILAARIGNILLNSDASPQNILCLTFTDAGVIAMRKRLLEFIGPEAQKIHIFTFHSFCNKVIRENIDAFGYESLEPVSDLERIDIIRSIIDDLEPVHPLRIQNRRNPYQFELRLRNLFSLMKTEGRDAAYINSVIDEYTEVMPSMDKFIYKRKTGEFQKGDIKKKEYDKEIRRLRELKSAAELFETFEQKMQELGRYDYDDMILWVLRLFSDDNHEDILRNYQEQYQYILVDEFQDTNGAQNGILMKLIEYWEVPNVFVVGDDDQSIFEFQGARVKNMIDFFGHYSKVGLKLIVLEENYRSGQAILDASKHVIDRNELRIIRLLESLDPENQISKNLIASNTEILKKETQISVCEYPNRLQEEIAVFNSIRELHEKGIPYNEMAVIYFMHKQSAELIRLFERHEIPYQTKRQINILSTPIIKNFILLLRYIAAEFEKPYSGEQLIYELLHVDFFGVPATDIAALSSYIATLNRQKHDNGDYAYLQWRDLLRDENNIGEIAKSEPGKILNISKLCDESLLLLMNNPIVDILEKLLNRSGIVAFMLQSPEKHWLTELMSTFFNFVREEAARNAGLDLRTLLVLFDRMADNKLEIPVIRNSYAADGVNLLTAHSAKGLEFECVFMLHCLAEFWEPAASKKSASQFYLPENFRKTNEETDSEEAARRLFYVAMTRAKTFLHLSYYAKQNNQKISKRASFIDDLIIDFELPLHVSSVPDEQVKEEEFLLLVQKEMPDSARIDKESIASLLQDFTLSVSSLNSYLECPRSFFYNNVLRIPSTSSPEALYGVAVHYALKKSFDDAQRAGLEKLPELEVFLDHFRQELFRKNVQLSPKAYADALKLGAEQLPEYYRQRYIRFGGQLSAEIKTEKSLKAYYKGIPLKGVIDKICFNGSDDHKTLHLADYKTGKLDDSRFVSINKRNELGGSYYRQLVFYKILIEHADFSPYKVKSAEIDYLSPDDSNIFQVKTLELDEKDAEAVGNLISSSYERIMAQEFSEGCEKKYCKWCNFVKTQRSPDSFRDEEEELLDD